MTDAKFIISTKGENFWDFETFCPVWKYQNTTIACMFDTAHHPVLVVNVFTFGKELQSRVLPKVTPILMSKYIIYVHSEWSCAFEFDWSWNLSFSCNLACHVNTLAGIKSSHSNCSHNVFRRLETSLELITKKKINLRNSRWTHMHRLSEFWQDLDQKYGNRICWINIKKSIL